MAIKLKDGYVVKMRNGDLAMVFTNFLDELCISSDEIWEPVKFYDDDLNYAPKGGKKVKEADIVEVYGRSINRQACKISTEDRELLWKRNESDAVGEDSDTDKDVKEIMDNAVEDFMKHGMSEEDAKMLVGLIGLSALVSALKDSIDD